MPSSSHHDDRMHTDRRRFLTTSAGMLAAVYGASAGVALSNAACAVHESPAAHEGAGPAVDLPRGAIYIPARSYNAYQTWRDFDAKITDRDAGYAQGLKLNAFRIWLSFEFWRHDRTALQHRLAKLLHTCSARGIRVMPVLFEGDGVEPTPGNIVDTNPFTASDLLSPAARIVGDRKLWGPPREYVEWFMHYFRNDRRLLAIEVHNEPWGPARHAFARAMVIHAAKRRGAVPLTVGGADLSQSRSFIDAGIDILQTHQNFPPAAAAARSIIHNQIIHAQKALHRPVWLTEWQRLRPGGQGWGKKPLHHGEWQPDYASLAPVVQAQPIGNFFWSLMLKPAWLLPQRNKGTLNGVFHEDGAVWSLADARAIARDEKFHAKERRAWPAWAEAIPKKLGLP